MGIIQGVLGFLSAPITQLIKNSGEKAKAKHTRELRKITGEQTWEERQAEASNGSWKDEYLTVLITVPFITTFTSAFVDAMFDTKLLEANGKAITSLSALPPEYWYLMSATFAAAFAIKGIPKAVAKLRENTIKQTDTKDAL